MKKLIYVGGIRGLVIFLLINKVDLKETIFIFENKNNINLPNKFSLDLEERKRENKYLKKYKIYKIFKKSLKNIDEIWIQDHLPYADYFISKFRNIKLVEDGLSNYNLKYDEKSLKRHIKIKNWILGGSILVDDSKFGISKNISEIYLTGLKEIPKEIKNKTKIINLKELWNESSIDKKEEVYKVFNLKEEFSLDREIILITQPLSEDKIITEEEKVNIYGEIVSKYGEENIIIKPHPREKTDYKSIFSKTEVLIKDFPIEIMTFTMKKIKKVITIFSTAAYNFEGIAEEIEFLGTEINSKLVEKFGKIKK